MPTFGGMIIHAERAIDKVIDIHRVRMERKDFHNKLHSLVGVQPLLRNIER